MALLIGKKTLVIGDTHLKFSIIKPRIEEILESEEIEEVVFMGDYFDEWQQSTNTQLYIEELLLLITFKKDCAFRGIKTIFLIGNHDLPYILRDYFEPYTLQCDDIYIKEFIRNTLLDDLEVQFVYQIGRDYLASHAGFVASENTKLFYFNPLTRDVLNDNLDEIKCILYNVPTSRGGYERTYGSCVWSDFGKDLVKYPNKSYRKQIVSHTPQEKITTINDLTCVDTLSVTSRFTPTGNTEVLIVNKDDTFTKIKLFEIEEYKELVKGKFLNEN